MLSYRSACPEFKDGLGINMTMKTSFILAYHIMFGVVLSAHAKPYAHQQIARDLEVDYTNFLTNVRGPPDKYGLLTLGRPCVRCYSTLRAWFPVYGSTLRVSHVCNCLGPVLDLPSSRKTSFCWKG